MKKIIYISWTVLLVILLLVWVLLVQKRNQSPDLSNVFTANTVDSLLGEHESLLMLTIGYGECGMCDILLGSDMYLNTPFVKYHIDVTKNDNNKLLSQALYITGFPTTVVMDRELDLRGIISGMAKWREQMDSICHLNHPMYGISVENIPQDSLPEMLSFSLKALFSYWKHDMDKTEYYAQSSLAKGSYFFNNYLLYRVAIEKENFRKANEYRQSALRHSKHVNAVLYENLIQELTPQTP